MKKAIVINIFLLLFLFFFFDFILYQQCKNNYNLNIPYGYLIKRNVILNIDEEIKYWRNYPFRKPINENSEEKSIVFTGCSFMYGFLLEENQTFSYKISHMTSRPIYNFGIPAGGLNHLLTIIKNGVLFEKIKKTPEIIVYVYADFHIPRFIISDIAIEPHEYLYKIKNNKLVRKTPPSIIPHFYILCFLKEHFYNFLYSNNKIYQNYLKKMLKMFFLEIKNGIDSKYPDVKFIILEYYPSPLFDEIKEELENSGFIIIDINKEFGIETLDAKKYQLEDGHPNEYVWDLITPKFYEKVQQYL